MILRKNIAENNFFINTIFAFSILLLGLNILLRFKISFFYSVETGGIDLNVIEGVLKILKGNFLYTDPAAPNYDIMQYTPLHYYLVAGIGKLFNITGNDPQDIFILCRLAGLITNLLASTIIFFLAQRFKISPKLSFVAAAFSFIILTQHYYSRVDGTYGAFFFASVYLFSIFIQTKKSRPLILFALSSFLCIITKQSGIILILSSLFFLIIKNQIRYAGIVISILTFLSIIFLLMIPSVGGLTAFYRNVVCGLDNGTSIQFYLDFIEDKYFIQSIPWIVIGFFLAIKLLRAKIADEIFYLALLILASLIFAFVTGFKNGSSLNYFIEAFILIVICGLNYFSGNQSPVFAFIFYGYVLLTIIFKTGGFFNSVYRNHYRHSEFNNYLIEKNISMFISGQHLQKNDFVYTDFRGFTEMFLFEYSILNQKDISYYIDQFAGDVFHYSELKEKCNEGLIRFAVTKNKNGVVTFLNEKLTNFYPVKRIGTYTILEYRKPY